LVLLLRVGENDADVTGVSTARRLRALRRPRGDRRFLALGVALIVGVGACSYTAAIDPVPLDPSQSSKILSADGTLLTRLDLGEHREAIELDEMGADLVDAVIAIEDHRYFDHDGVDLRAIGRALREDIRAGEVVEGGSTITQQYVRNVLLTRDQTVHRKLREAVLAMQLERTYTKREILERYLNEVYFGNGAYGAQAAADRYFAKPASELELHEAALLAGLLRAPGDYDPFSAPERARERRNEVIDAMVEYDRLDASIGATAKRRPLGVSGSSWAKNTTAPHFVDAVKRWFLSNPAFGESVAEREHLLYQGGLRIETTLDLRRQLLAEASVRQVLTDPVNDPAAALVSIEPDTGHVVAYVGGRDYWGSGPAAKFDLAGQAKRQTGSTFKPFVLLAAIADGIPLSTEYDAPSQITIPVVGQEPWEVSNYDDEGFGSLDLVDATVKSVNTVFAQLIMDVTPKRAVEVAAEAGVRSPLRPYPSATLGSNEASVLDVASAYSTFAADGLHADPVFVTKVVDPGGTVLFEQLPRRDRVFDETAVRTLNHTLEQVVTRGTGVEARIGRPVAAKTGTGEEYRDAWFVGSTPQLTTAVWIGFVEPEPMLRPRTREKVTGGGWPAKIWARYMSDALADLPAEPFPLPEAGGNDPGETPPDELVPTAPIADVVLMRLETARDILEDAGYIVDVVEQPDRQYPPGTVLAQSPSANTAVRAGTVVTLTVAGGAPRKVTVPNFLGLVADEILYAAAAHGVHVELITQAEATPIPAGAAGRSWQQSPAEGTRVDEGSTIQVWINPIE
jgi:penicillin-binding protein 1A